MDLNQSESSSSFLLHHMKITLPTLSLGAEWIQVDILGIDRMHISKYEITLDILKKKHWHTHTTLVFKILSSIGVLFCLNTSEQDTVYKSLSSHCRTSRPSVALKSSYESTISRRLFPGVFVKNHFVRFETEHCWGKVGLLRNTCWFQRDCDAMVLALL